MPEGRRRVAVLLMARELDQGGVERDVAKIATHLDPLRFETHVASYYAHGLRYEELRTAGVPLLSLELRSILSIPAFSAARRLRDYIRRHSIEVVHSYDVSGVLGVPVARSARVPAVISSQLSYRGILDSRTRLLLRLTDRCSHAVVVNCEAIRRYMIEEERVPAERVELCYNGVETRFFHPGAAMRPEPLADATLVIGVVCALRPEKGLKLLQQAFASTKDLIPGMKLLIVGSGPELPSLLENVTRLGIAGSSVFIPATRDVPDWLRAMDIFVLPSYSEAFSNSLLEAMACGCACIGSRVGGTPELIGDDERGLLFSRGDSADLAAKLTAFIVNPDLRLECASRAARFAAENLSIEIAARRTAQIYEKLLDRAGRKNAATDRARV